MADIDASVNKQRLDSWKAIAAFFGRDERTVNRWEKELGLPIHRLPGKAKGRIYAYTDELTQWLESSHPEMVPASAALPAPKLEGAESPVTRAGVPDSSPSLPPRRHLVTLVGVALVGVIGASGLLHWQSTFSMADHKQSSEVPGGNTDDLYFKGRFYWNKRTPDSLRQAIEFFSRAIAQNPDDARSYAGLADCYNVIIEYSDMPMSQALPLARTAATKAVELDDQLAEGHAALAFNDYWWSQDARSAEKEFKRALALKPDFADAHHWYATMLDGLGHYPEALAEINQAQRLAPTSNSILADKGWILYTAGQVEEAIDLLRQMVASEPSFISSHTYLSRIDFSQKNYPDYLVEARKFALLAKDEKLLAINDAAADGFAKNGSTGMLEAILKVQKSLYSQHKIDAYAVGKTYAQLGDKRQAWQYLQLSHDNHEGELPYIVGDLDYRNALGDEPAFQQMLNQLQQK